MGLFNNCKHEWTLLSETTTKSKFEVALAASVEYGVTKEVTVPHQMCCAERKYIQVFTCNECGDLKRFVEEL